MFSLHEPVGHEADRFLLLALIAGIGKIQRQNVWVTLAHMIRRLPFEG
jgi:hypothetical protein